jgi:xanthine dehydrogenase small subunit
MERESRAVEEEAAGDAGVFRPMGLAELFALRAAHPEAHLLAGGTDLGVELSLRGRRFPALIALDRIPELQAISETPEWIDLGAAISFTELRGRLGGRIPLLAALFPLFASLPIRNRATLGGNLATASPVGDGAPILLALGAQLRLVGPAGERILPLTDFFRGYRQTNLRPDELIAAVRIPLPLPGLSRFYKVAKRQEDDIATVSAAFALDLEPDGSVRQARLAFGGVAAVPARAPKAEAQLVGRPWSQAAVERAAEALAAEFDPLSDYRGTAAYRKAMVQNLLRKFWHETRREVGG